MMTQVQKIALATMFAATVKLTATQIERECKDYDETWALKYADKLRQSANKLLNDLKK